MKSKPKTMRMAVIIAYFCAITSASWAIVRPPIETFCMSAMECKKSVDCTAYCCETGGTGTGYRCPEGWSVLGTQCTRASSSGSDTTGTFTLEYDTCDAETYSYSCYVTSTSSIAANGNECLSCVEQ